MPVMMPCTDAPAPSGVAYTCSRLPNPSPIEPVCGSVQGQSSYCRLLLDSLPLVVAATCPSRPQLAIERAVLNGFRNVFACDVLGAGQVRDGARHFQNAVIGAGAQV